jgi:hypothetical protein
VSRPANLRRVHACLSNHGNIVGEYMWAAALGRDLYELLNIPFNLYGLNYRDVVRATRQRAHEDPEIRFVVRRSGHRTLRILFARGVPRAIEMETLGMLKPLGVGFEGGSDGFYALDLAPEGDLAAVCQRLEQWVALALLERYETCEARRPGSFDLPPPPRRPRVRPPSASLAEENSEP